MGKPSPWNPGMTRRDWVRRWLGGLSTATALPALASSHSVPRHPASGGTVTQAKAQSTAGRLGDTPSYLDSHQDATVTALAERILPGSTRAQVNRFLDLALAADSQENQRRFLAALAAFDGQALERFGRPFKDLTEAQQAEILTAASSASPGETERQKGLEWIESGVKASSDAARAPLREHFDDLKGWVVGAYYSSEIGMKELGWTGNHFFESFPGCQHLEEHK